MYDMYDIYLTKLQVQYFNIKLILCREKLSVQRKIKVTRQVSINDPFGQIHSLASSEHYFFA